MVVKNEFLLPYRAVIRVFFGDNSVKSIEATAVPKGDGKTALHWKLYRNFAISHPKDEGPINKVWEHPKNVGLASRFLLLLLLWFACCFVPMLL